jgi:signal transduction histidine kinase
MEAWERLLDDLRAEFLLREEELELLHDIDLELLRSERPLNAAFEFIIHRARKLFGAEHTTIMLRRGRYLEPSYSTSETDLGQRIDIATSLTGQCLSSDTTINVADLTMPPYDSQYIPIQGYTGEQMRSLIATPIKVHDTMVGVLSAESTRVGAFRSVHANMLAAIAAQVAIALQRMRLFDQNALFSDVDHLIFADAESPRVIQSALEKVMKVLQELEHIQLTDALIGFRRGNNLEVVHSTDPSAIGLVLGIDESICGRAVRERQTVILGDVSEEPEYRRLFGSSIQSEIAVPIILGDDNGDDNVVIGVVNVESEEKDAFQGFSQVILENFAEKVRTLLAFAKLRSDVTDAMELRNATDLLVAVGDQASHMIHRMNNTVGAMRMRILELQAMQETGELGPNEFLTESLEALRALAERTLQMPEEVTQILNQQSSIVDVNEAVRETVSKVRIPDNILLTLDLSADLPRLPLYCFDIVIQNLLHNALDAMPSGGKLSISTSSVVQPELPTGYVQIVVRDDGTGIPEDILPKVFDLNFSTKRTKGKGLGLGLWWIRNFVRRTRGDIFITSTVNMGTEVCIRIPVDRGSRTIAGSAHHEEVS